MPSFAPSPGRVALAWSAGLRPRARWVRVAGYVGLALVLAPRAREAWLGSTGELWADALGQGVFTSLEIVALARACGEGLWWSLLWLLLGALAVELIVALVSGQLGPIVRRRWLGRVGRWRDRGALIHLVLVIVALGLLGSLLGGVVAGGARSVDASMRGLFGLWAGWWSRAAVTVGLVLLGLGLIERRLGVYARWRALHRSADEVRAQRGGRD